MADWLWSVLVLAVAAGSAVACVLSLRGEKPAPDSQTRRCGQPEPANHVPECCRSGVHSPFWVHGYPCRYCGAESLVEPEPPTVPDHLWRPGE